MLLSAIRISRTVKRQSSSSANTSEISSAGTKTSASSPDLLSQVLSRQRTRPPNPIQNDDREKPPYNHKLNEVGMKLYLFDYIRIFSRRVVAGLPPRSGGVARALGPRRWTNNSTGLLDIK